MDSKNNYVHGKRDFDLDERCEDFDKIWMKIYREVLTYWDGVKIKEIKNDNDVLELVADEYNNN